MNKNIILNQDALIKLERPKESDTKKLSEIINIDEEMLKCWFNWYTYNGKWCYFKTFDEDVYFINELMGEQLAKHFGIDTVHYEVASYDVRYGWLVGRVLYGLMSENFRKQGMEYYAARDFGIRNNFDNMHHLNSKKMKSIFKDEKNYEIVINKLLKMTILDFYMNQVDRRDCNFCFSKDKNGYIDLCPLFDYEYSFIWQRNKYVNGIFSMNFGHNKEQKYARKSYVIQEQLYKLMDIDIEKVIKTAREQYSIIIPRDVISLYKENDKLMKSKVKEYKLIK